MIKKLKICGFRGFGKEQEISFALPCEDKIGSGLTIITGSNNSGKTTIVEAIRAFNNTTSPSISEGKRNIQTNGFVKLVLTDENDKSITIETVPTGGSPTNKNENIKFNYYIVPSRRSMEFEFKKMNFNRELYIANAQSLENQRSAVLRAFESRIFHILESKEKFDKLIKKILGYDFKWHIEQRDSSMYYIKYVDKDVMHSGEGLGDGIWSVFTICAAFVDAPEHSTIIIDEPELSIHPVIQKRLMKLFMDFSKNNQIIICTHSPYFINWNAIANGAQLIRIVKESTNSRCYCLTDEFQKKVTNLIKDLNNPHILGLEANEVFFLEDNIILVEGQEDIIILKKIAKKLGKNLEENFFGWGVGGAPKMKIFLNLFKNLGYHNIAVILDGDQKSRFDELKTEFESCGYKFYILPTDDIRDKRERTLPEKNGIADEKGNLKDTYKEQINKILDEIQAQISNK